MDLSVIIVSHDSAGYLPRCLASLETHLRDVAHEVCVVDNGSTDGTVAEVEARFPQVQVIANERNLGFAAGVNLGLQKTGGRYVLWLNPDAELLDGGTAELIRYLEAHPAAGILGPQLLDSDGSVQLSCRRFPSFRTALFNRYSLLTRWFPSNPGSRDYLYTDWDHASIRYVDWVSGAGLLHRREVSDALGGLDERYFMYCEDVDFCLSARRTGWAVAYHPGLHVRHHIAGSSRRHPARTVIARHRSMWRYYAKHFPRHLLKDAAVGAGIWGRCAWLLAWEALRHRSPDGHAA